MAIKRLGSGVNTAAIYDRTGREHLLTLDGLTTLEWGRVRDAASTAKLSISRGRARECWQDLGKVHPWGHTLVVFRDGRRVWEGPIRRPVHPGAGLATIEAVDVFGWTGRRRVRKARKFSEKVTSSVMVEFDKSLRAAMLPDDPNVIAHFDLRRNAAEAKITRAVEANSTMHYDDLVSLCGQGAHMTTIGRRIVAWPEATIIGQLAELLPGEHLTGEPEVSVSGDDLCTMATTTGTDGAFGTAFKAGTVNGVDPFYGLHDRLFEGGEVKQSSTLVARSKRVLGQLYPAPVLLSVPDNSGLSCESPFTVDELVPGVLVPLVSNETPRQVTATMVLTAMNVTQDLDGETVSISLAPATDLAGA